MKKYFLLLLIIFSSFFLYAQEGEEFSELVPFAVQELKADNTGASLIIESDVPLAEVYLNSVYQGKTRLRVRNLVPAQYILQICKDGKKSKKYYITARKGYVLSYKVLLNEIIIDTVEDISE